MKTVVVWSVSHTARHGYPFLRGVVDGYKYLSSSPIVAVEEDGTLRTRSGSRYRLSESARLPGAPTVERALEMIRGDLAAGKVCPPPEER